ncbi:TPA: Dam family site-specific DNA-(adenine-N6)-methyltransferase [Citrobacter freundii]|uniref:DNA adenine methylase n=1 Tax=Citrobacter freundii TaxID=546 RepID=UPI001905048F|nr:Dam family site-specific DNA-(adenine-N6)-methyltransferase [Citrobacter freundii]MBJ9298964.1 Dam family site-specific DNA-(adenine-N6)-methyltransferase [Citrobacter freundii]MBJ9534027.1 Dam family site-specific DNA-(adenine-N6)-methyltransferase [Citrobacter freundii]MCU0185550.1 Dam family site-specific DNA-(adenine-N6)-methyltransferase [Citrobacter freundii]MDU1170743.1 Dam family site-specific DNA-(adenine-N6)-methyltransferase [Citrobacter freundii]MDU1219302.1 Dam family site-spec
MIKSPLKWVGGKTRVMPQLLEHLPKADCLIEPFVGSGTVFLNTNYRSYILCDSNRALINFFRVLTADTERLINIARSMFHGDNTKERYYERRKLFNSMQWSDTTKADPALLYAALFLYLNRHGYNGLYRANLKGEFNVPFGKYAAPYFPLDEMRLFAEKANDTKAIFMHSDFRLSIRAVVYASYDAVIYCDPPYIPASETANFTAYGKPFTLDEHRSLVTNLLNAHRQFGHRAVISNSDTPETREIYSAFNLHSLSVRRSVSAKSRDMAGEVIGVLRVCDGCGRAGGGYCPDCGLVTGDGTNGVMFLGFDPAKGCETQEPF